jgi:hypothetical protein
MQRNTTYREIMIDENGLQVGNDPKCTHYWTRDDHERESVNGLAV